MKIILPKFRLPERLAVFCVLVLFFPLAAAAQGFTVKDFDLSVKINREGYFDVTETYQVLFDVEKHGLWRKIPLEYRFSDPTGAASTRTIRITDIRVPGWKYKVERKNGNLGIKIGDPDRLISGQQQFAIQYRVDRAFIFTDSSSMFYWNLLGQEWEAVFENIRFSVTLPDDLPLAKDKYFVYSGQRGETGSDAYYKYAEGVFSGKSLDQLGHGKDMTLLLKLPRGYIRQKSNNRMLWEDFQWALFLLPLVIGFYAVWNRYGRDKRVPIAVEYFPPKNVDPVQAGYLVDDRPDTRDLTALIPFWGAAGYLTLTEKKKESLFGKKDILLKKLKDLPTDAMPYEHSFFNGPFGGGEEVLVSSLKDSFYTTMSRAKGDLSAVISGEGYYIPQSERLRYIMAVAFVLIGIAGAYLMPAVYGNLAVIIWILACVVLAGLSFKLMRKPTGKGDEVKQQVMGFRMFVEKAEKNQLETLLKEDPGYFDKTLAYAIAFGMAAHWAKKFDGLDMRPPTWYYGSSGYVSGSGFNAASFTDGFNQSMSKMASTMVSSPSGSGSGGGGSSGGGFGGGGGGSW